MFGLSLPGDKHGLQAITATVTGLIGVLAPFANVLPPKAGALITAASLIVAAYSQKPGTPKAP